MNHYCSLVLRAPKKNVFHRPFFFLLLLYSKSTYYTHQCYHLTTASMQSSSSHYIIIIIYNHFFNTTYYLYHYFCCSCIVVVVVNTHFTIATRPATVQMKATHVALRSADAPTQRIALVATTFFQTNKTIRYPVADMSNSAFSQRRGHGVPPQSPYGNNNAYGGPTSQQPPVISLPRRLWQR